MPQTITVAIDEAIATITLNRPERLNAYTVQMGVELYTSLQELERNDAVRVIIVTGAGRAFCAGMDLERGGDSFAAEGQFNAARALENAVHPWNFGKPIIAAINGPAVGIGATWPLQWDIRLAAESARIGFVFTRRGIVAEAHSTWILPRLVGMSVAMELMLTGRIIDAQEALRLGLVSRVVPDASLMTEARALALDIARHTAPVSVAVTKKLLWRQLMENDPRRAKAVEDALFAWAGQQPDAAEGVRAFIEKRPPQWSMSASKDGPPDLESI